MWQKIFDLFISKFGEFFPKNGESIYEGSSYLVWYVLFVTLRSLKPWHLLLHFWSYCKALDELGVHHVGFKMLQPGEVIEY
jgi:hypothetical protein